MILRPGDEVALIAPASGQRYENQDLVDKAIELLTQWGLSVVLPPRLSAHRYLSAIDDERAENLINALTHPRIKAVFVTRGGYGCARLLPRIKEVSIPSPRFVVGFSDITTLHLHGLRQKNWISVHGPNVATEQFLDHTSHSVQNRISLHKALFDGVYDDVPLTPMNPNAQLLQRGGNFNLGNESLVGGCLSLLVTSLGTDHEINTVDKVLMIEEVGESPYKVDRMLTHLRNAGKFSQVSAVVFGDMISCSSSSISISDILEDEFSNDTFPVFTTESFGHGKANFPWLYNASL